MNRSRQVWKTDRAARSVPGQLADLSGCLLYGRAFPLVALSCLSVQARLCHALLLRFPLSLSLFLSPVFSHPAPTPTCRASNSTPDRSILLLLRAVFCPKPCIFSLSLSLFDHSLGVTSRIIHLLQPFHWLGLPSARKRCIRMRSLCVSVLIRDCSQEET